MRFVSRHILPLILAVLAWWMFRHQLEKTPENKIKFTATKNYLVDLAHDSAATHEIAIRIGTDGLLLFGSSELTNGELQYIPYRFFNQKENQATAVGQAGNQCFQILCTLLPFSGGLKHEKVVILLSPGWFEEYAQGTNPANFAANISERTLYGINACAKEKYQLAVGEYLHRHYTSFSEPPAIVSLLKSKYEKQAQWFNGPAWINEEGFDWYCQKKWKGMSKFKQPVLVTHETGFDPQNFMFDWDSIAHAEKTAFLKTCDRNSLYVDNAYYEEYIAKKPYRDVHPFNYATAREWHDFKLLVNFLQEENINAFFVMQPLNPYYFRNLEAFGPLLQAVEQETTSKGFGFFNFFTSNRSAYAPGTLKDVMHPGEYGWMKMDSAIVNYYQQHTHAPQ